jgi:hypothetical protein
MTFTSVDVRTDSVGPTLRAGSAALLTYSIYHIRPAARNIKGSAPTCPASHRPTRPPLHPGTPRPTLATPVKLPLTNQCTSVNLTVASAWAQRVARPPRPGTARMPTLAAGTLTSLCGVPAHLGRAPHVADINCALNPAWGLLRGRCLSTDRTRSAPPPESGQRRHRPGDVRFDHRILRRSWPALSSGRVRRGEASAPPRPPPCTEACFQEIGDGERKLLRRWHGQTSCPWHRERTGSGHSSAVAERERCCAGGTGGQAARGTGGHTTLARSASEGGALALVSGYVRRGGAALRPGHPPCEEPVFQESVWG